MFVRLLTNDHSSLNNSRLYSDLSFHLTLAEDMSHAYNQRHFKEKVQLITRHRVGQHNLLFFQSDPFRLFTNSQTEQFCLSRKL